MTDQEERTVFDPQTCNLESYRVKSAPETIYYIPDFLTKDEEEYLLQKVYGAPTPKWTQLSNRRLQNWGGHPHPKGMISEDLPAWLHIYTKKIAHFHKPNSEEPMFPKEPNHVLVNEYHPGQGIMPHVDGPVFHPVISTINLGSHTVLDYYHSLEPNTNGSNQNQMPSFTTATEVEQPNSQDRTGFEERYAFSLLLEPSSLVLVTDKMYTDFLHGIKAVKSDVLTESIVNLDQCGRKVGDVLERRLRVSLTIRLAQKTSKFKLNIFRT